MSEPFAALSGRYQLHETLGGSESLICRGYDPAASRWVAIKTPNDAVRADPKRLRGFLEPARALQTVSSPFVIRIHELIEAGQLDDRPYGVSEWLDTDLAAIMARGALPLYQAERLLRNLTTGLRDLHQAGVLHRDLNPRNVLLSDDLADLRIADPGGHQTFAQAAQYSAPELYRPDQVVDARSDLFALGMIAYELLLGPERFREVFAEIYETDEPQHNTCWMNWQLDPSRAAPPLAELNPRIPRYLSDWVANLLAKDPARRCPDAAAALAGLAQEEEPILRPDAPPPQAPRRPPRPEPPLWKRPGFIAVVVLVWVILPLGLWWATHEDPDRVQIETALLPEVNGARQAAVAEGAEHPPPVAGLTAGDAAKAEAKAAFDRKDYAASRSRLETARAQFQEALQQAQARNREAEQAQDASAARRAEAVRAGGEGLARFREADVRHQAGLAALPPKNAPAAQAAFAEAQIGFAAVVAEAGAIQARARMQAARTAAEQARAQASPDFQRGATLAQEAEGAFEQSDFPAARERFDAAAAAFARARSWRPPSVTVELGSTPAELRAAQALCQRYPAPGLDCQAELAGEAPSRVTLRPATLDPTEVTRAAFARFVQQTGYRTEAEQRGYSYLWGALGAARANGATWRTGSAAPEQDNRPMAHVTRQDALAYCQWAGQRLPSEDEWEYAARGAERRLFPWGAAWDESRAVWNGGGVQPVGARPAGATPEGVQDLAGNVWEWTATPAPGGGDGIAKGGSWLGPPVHLRAAARLVIAPDRSFADLGFRCAR